MEDQVFPVCLKRDVPLREQISLDTYTSRIYECLLQEQGCSREAADRCLAAYAADLEAFYAEDYMPETSAFGMLMYLR